MIRTIAKVAVAAAAVGGLQLGAVAPAEAQTGFLCGFASITDPTVEGDVQTGEINGGPLAAADTDNPGEEAATIAIRCTIQVGAQGATHAGADAYAATSPTNPGVAVLPAHQFTYVAPSGSPVYLCSSAIVNGQIRYWDSVNDPVDTTDGGWQTTSGHDCLLAISQEVDPGDGSELDPIICPPLALVLGSDGDIEGVWNCPPYES